MANIYLIGMMGAGKTSTGRALATILGMDFVDLDSEIESRTHQSINEIFSSRGEAHFRSEEKRALQTTAAQKNAVVATGGGIVLDPANVALMRSTGRVLYLAASFEMLWGRVRSKKDRPLLKVTDPKATFLGLFGERRPLYESSAHQRVETDGKTPEAVAEWIAKEGF